MRTRSLTLSLLLLIVALAGFGTVRPSLADSPDQISLGIAPLDYKGQYFDLTMAPGESRELKVEVANHGAKQIAARTYAADAYSITGGGFGARLDGEPATGTTLWLAYPSQTIDLPPGQGLTRSFSVTVPADAEPGEYITSLVVQNAEPTAAGSGGVVIRQVQRTVIAVAITVPGERKPALAIGAVEHKFLSAKSIVTATVTNTGNVRLKPSGELVVAGMDGREVSRFALTMDSVYAGGTASIEIPFEKALLPGDYHVTLTLDYEGGTARAVDVPLKVPKPTQAEAGGAPSAADGTAVVNQQQPTPRSRLSPRFVIVAGGAALALVIALIVVRLRRRRSPFAGPPERGREPRDGPAAVSPAGLSQSDAARVAARSASAPPPTPLRYPLAKAAGDQEDARPRAFSRVDRSAFGSPLQAPPTENPSNPSRVGDAAPPEGGEQDGIDSPRLGRLSGQRSASTPPAPDSDTRQQ